MGKNLKGKECGKGICQRKDGKYTARFSPECGGRREKHFDTLPAARNWLADMQYAERHGELTVDTDMTVNMWFDYWMNNLICDLPPQYQAQLSRALYNQHSAVYRLYENC